MRELLPSITFHGKTVSEEPRGCFCMSPPNYRPHLSRDRKSDGQLEHTKSSPVLNVVVVLRMRARVFGVLKVEQPYSKKKKTHFAKRTQDVQVFLRLCDCCACSLCFYSRHFEGPARALTHPEKNIGRDPRKEKFAHSAEDTTRSLHAKNL